MSGGSGVDESSGRSSFPDASLRLSGMLQYNNDGMRVSGKKAVRDRDDQQSKEGTG